MKKFILLPFLCLGLYENSFAQEFEIAEGGNILAFNIIDDSNVELIRPKEAYSYYSGDIKIPSTVIYNNIVYTVTTVNRAFRDCQTLESVYFPSTITTLITPFYHNEFLKNIIFETRPEKFEGFLWLGDSDLLASNSTLVSNSISTKYVSFKELGYGSSRGELAVKDKKSGLWGIVDYDDNIIVPFEYDDFENRYDYQNIYAYSFKKNGKWGLIDLHNNILYPFVIGNRYKIYTKTRSAFKTAQKKYAADQIEIKNNLRSRLTISYLMFLCKTNQLRLENEAKEKEIQKQRQAEKEAKRPIPKQDKTCLWGFCEKETGKQITPFIYNQCQRLNDNYYLICQNEKYGIFSIEERTEKINPQYDVFEQLGNNIYLISKNGKFGTFSTAIAQEIISPQYDLIDMETYFLIYKSGKVGVMDKSGKIQLHCKYDNIIPIAGPQPQKPIFYLIYQNKWGLGNIGGESCKCKYDYIADFHAGKATIYFQNYTGEINTKGEIIKGISQNLFEQAYNMNDAYASNKLQIYLKAIEIDNILKEGYVGSCYCNIGVLYENAGDYDTALKYYSLSSSAGNTQGAVNYKNLRRTIRAAKWQAIGNALSNMATALNNTMMQYNGSLGNRYTGGNENYTGSGGDNNSKGRSCKGCNGTGRCSMCKGKGWYKNSHNGKIYDCPACHKTGECKVCYGKGYIN